MKQLILAAAALLMAETPAFACSCSSADDPAELQRYAAEIGTKSVALVEAEALTAYEATRTGERMRVLRTLGGSAAPEFTIERSPHASSASCDVLYRVGERSLVILFPTEHRDAGLPVYRTSGLCTAQFLHDPMFQHALIRALNSRGERG